MKETVLMLILTSTSMCTINNIDHSTVETIEFDSMETCEKAAGPIDARANIRAICMTIEENPTND